MTNTELLQLKKPGRKPHGMAAVLLPFEVDGRVAWDALAACVRETHDAGLIPAINMDTGYCNYLTDAEHDEVIEKTRQALPAGGRFAAGAYVEGRDGDLLGLYRKRLTAIASKGGIPVVIQSSRAHGFTPVEKAKLYADICRGFPEVIGFELGKVFAPNGEIWDDETFVRMMEIPTLTGSKHSSLDRMVEIRRLAMRDQHRPEFRVYTGNDWGIDMIEYGSDYLLGLATFSPAKFAERDRLWAIGDPAYYALSDALQYLGNIAFRAPVPAYKHSAAKFLHLLGKIPSDLAHPKCPARPMWDVDILRDCAVRLGLL